MFKQANQRPKGLTVTIATGFNPWKAIRLAKRDRGASATADATPEPLATLQAIQSASIRLAEIKKVLPERKLSRERFVRAVMAHYSLFKRSSILRTAHKASDLAVSQSGQRVQCSTTNHSEGR